MGLIEVEIEPVLFQNLVLFLTRQAPIPDPTFEVLGADRLIRRFDCGDKQRGDVHFGEAAPDLPMPAGTVPVRADLVIGHASVAEIEADGDAETLTPATGWLQVSLERQRYGPAKGRYAVTVRLVRVDIEGRPPTIAFDQPGSPRFGRPPLAVLPLPLPKMVKDLEITGAAVFLSDHAATLRLATAGQDLFAERQDRIVDLNKSWIIRFSPQIFTEMLDSTLRKAVDPPPGGTELIAAPTTMWTSTQILRPSDPAAPAGWGVDGSLRLRKRNACGLLSKVDVSMTVSTTLLPVPDIVGQRVTFWLEIIVNPDDGTAFECWVAEGGPLLTALLAGTPLLALAATLGGLAIFGGLVSDEVKDAVSDEKIPDGFTKVESGDDYTIQTATMDLDLSALAELIMLDYAVAGPDGLVVGGPAGPKAPYVGLIGHAPQFAPAGGALHGAWASGYSCGKGWRASYELPLVHINDPVVAPDGTPVPGLDGKPLQVPVAVFPTSYVVPSQHWTIETPPTVEDQYVAIVSDLFSSSGPYGNVVVNAPSHVVMHTSAGLRRYGIAPVPKPPEPPTPAQLIVFKGNCEMLVHEANNVHWLVDPPEFDYGHETLRHWRIAFDGLVDGGSVTVHSVHPDGRVSQLAVLDRAITDTGQVIEAVTDKQTYLRVSHGLRSNQPVRAQVAQQWLLPTTSVALGGTPTELTVEGDKVKIAYPPTVFSLSTGMTLSGSTTPLPGAVELPDGRIAAVHEGHLILAMPFGGAAVRDHN